MYVIPCAQRGRDFLLVLLYRVPTGHDNLESQGILKIVRKVRESKKLSGNFRNVRGP